MVSSILLVVPRAASRVFRDAFVLSILPLLCGLAPSGAHAIPESNPTAELIHFTKDGSESGAPLLPGFLNHSIWSGLGVASNGKIYIAVSNHQQPGGNVGVYRYDPAANEMVTLGDIKSISTAAGNWMADETQYKVHTFLLEHADGYLYFASDDHAPSPFLRGTHLYRIDPATDVVEDYTQSTPYVMLNDLSVIENTGQNAEQSGIFIETYGIKGIGLHPGRPDLLYAMTYPDGHLIKYDLTSGAYQVVGQSTRVAYAFHVSEEGDVYYADIDGSSQTLYKYDESSDSTSIVQAGLPGAPNGEIGSTAPTADGRYVYFMLAASREVWRLDTQLDTFVFFANTCGTNYWRIYNLSLSPDEQSLYFVSNNNDFSTIRRIDVATGNCSQVLDVNTLLGSRNLSFGGIGVWDDDGHFYAPVWTFQGSPPDPALLKVKVEVPEPSARMLGVGGILLLVALAKRSRRASTLRSRGAC